MEQMSFLNANIPFPETYEDIQNLWDTYISEGDTDEDAFTSKSTVYGASYSFYGEKAFEFKPGSQGKSRLRLPTWLMLRLFPEKEGTLKEDSYYTVKSLDTHQMELLLAFLREKKNDIFRNSMSHWFGCCHDFRLCSDAKACVHQDDRFYNGCMYRTNLESGRIFYGKNRNV